MAEPVVGGCLCGAIRYRITGTPLSCSLCHCDSCRMVSGASPVAWIVVPRDALAFTSGEPVRFRSSPPVERSFCGACGTPLTYRHDDTEATIDVTLCTLDAPDAFTPDREVWISHRMRWVQPTLGLTQYPRGTAEGAAVTE